MLSLLFVLFIAAPSRVFLSCILDVSGSGLRTLETGVGTLVSVSVTVVDAQTIPWYGRTTPGSLPRYAVSSFCTLYRCPPRVSFLVAFLMCPVPGSGHFKLVWGHLCL